MTRTVRKLTSLENDGLLADLNVADGHPRMDLTASQRSIIAKFPAMFDDSALGHFDAIEEAAHRAFLHGLGQLQAPIGTGRILSCYSSSVAMDMVARVIGARTGRIALVHPTFDNIADLLRARGLSLVSAAESDIARGHLDLPDDVGAVFVTTPNNPTGWVLGEEGLARLAAWCRDTGRALALDTCFRGQDRRAQYDTYAVLLESGVDWVVIEDTGKLWPMQELKAGFLLFCEALAAPFVDAFDDLLLTVSPVVLLLIRQLAEDANARGYREMSDLIDGNRRLLAETADQCGLRLTDPDSRISVARLTVPARWGPASDLYDALAKRGVNALPCDAFYWDQPAMGAGELRIALARNREDVLRAAAALQEICKPYSMRETGR